MKISTIAVLSCFLFACAKETNTSLPKSFTCSIDGEPWTAESSIIDRRENKINVTGHLSGGEMVIIEVRDWGEKVYDLTNYECFGSMHGVNSKFYSTNNNGSGSLTISSIAGYEYNKRMSGTFSFTAYTNTGEKKEITNGQFTNVPFIE